jgi:hypothetical protein
VWECRSVGVGTARPAVTPYLKGEKSAAGDSGAHLGEKMAAKVLAALPEEEELEHEWKS